MHRSRLPRCGGGCDSTPISRDDVLSWLKVYSQALAENKDYLTRLDSSIGDADHGVNMERGFSLMARGKANVGDKTMVDALIPALHALKQAVADGVDEREALRQSVVAAEQGMKNTIPMVARRGRASYLAERSAGHQDPGATSSYLMFKAMEEAWTTK